MTESSVQLKDDCISCQITGVVFGVGIVLSLLRMYFNGGVNRNKRDLKNQIVVITGSNTGIGFETAKDVVQNNGKVILACRDKQRAQQALNELNKIKPDAAEFMRLDLSDLSSVRLFVNEFNSKYSKLDILVNNAGIMHIPELVLTKDGFESQIGTNHFGHFLLTNLLLDKLKQSESQFRVITVSSLAHTHGSINLDDLHFQKRKYNRIEAYAQSKISNILFTMALQKKIDNEKLNGIAVCLHPGVVRTELQRHWTGILGIIKTISVPFSYLLFKSPLQGAQTSLYCIHEEFNKLQKGKYYSDCAVKNVTHKQINNANADLLWDISTKAVKL